MSSSIRQSELFAGNDWTVIYKAFTSINLNAFDYNSILQSMVQYINQNYPEVFNDWTDNDEYMVLIQLIANLAESLAFRMDLNARENFFDLARRRESVLRLARFLSYNPKRNISATGMIKISSIQTSDTIYDSNGNDLSNITVSWNDTTNQNWYEQFITILNASFVSTNPFGTYLAQMDVNNVTSQVYRINSQVSGLGVYGISANINANGYPFEIVNTELNSTSTGYQEVTPDLTTPFQLVYMNDGNGNGSNNTGFFSMIKQGTLAATTYSLSVPIENRTIQIGAANINQNDLWVQTVDDNGFVVTNGNWTRVGYVPTEDTTKVILTGDNISYNGVPASVRNIYQDITQTNDDVILRFGDGRFGATPTGNLRIWYRTSANENLIVTPDDLDNVTISIPYYNTKGVLQTLTINYILEETISNASVSETIDQIRQRASSVYSTQGRMVSGNDYNSLPLSNQEVMKIKAINRIYSGQSRYIDLNDPTGNYQSTNTFCDDGALYIDENDNYSEVSTSKQVSDIVYDYISPIISNYNLQNFLINYCIDNSSTLGYQISSGTVLWNNVLSTNYSSTGNFVDSNGNILTIGSGSNNTALSNMTVGSLIKITDTSNNIYWVTISGSAEYQDSNGDTHNGYIIDSNVPNGSSVILTLPLFRSSFTSSDIANIETKIQNKKSFGIGLDFSTQSFYYIDISQLNETSQYNVARSNANNSDSSWIIYCEYSPYTWMIHSRSLKYIFESKSETKFFYVNTFKSVDQTSGKVGSDEIKILKYNFTKNDSDILFTIKDNYEYSDGYIEPRRVYVDFTNDNYNETPDDPEAFYNVMNKTGGTFVFHKMYTDSNGYTYWQLFEDVNIITSSSIPSTIPSGSVYFTSDTKTFYVSSTDSVNNYSYNIGTDNLSFQWRHLAPVDQRIDPSISNIIDIYVLTNSYNTSMKTWRDNGSIVTTLPSAPTEIDLQNTFSDLEEYKMFSDTIIWKPVKFKLIGGNGSDPQYKFTLKIIKLNSTTVSDGQIKSDVITAVNKYFDITSGWDFGDTFYASELIAYLHVQLADTIASVILVPSSSDQHFGDLFQIDSNSEELFFPTLTVNNVDIISTLTQTNMRIS